MKKIINQALDLVLSLILFAIAVFIVFGVVTNRVTFVDLAESLVLLLVFLGVRELSRIRRALEQLAKTAG